MDYKEILKPNIWKIIKSFILTFFYWLILIISKFGTICDCIYDAYRNRCQHYPNITGTCCQPCIGIGEFIGNLIIFIILPFLVFYVLISLMEYYIRKYKR